MRRVVIPELLDTDAGTPEEISASLADLRAINRRFGGVRTTRRMVEHVAQVSGLTGLSLLDVAAGSGDVAAAVKQDIAPRGVHLTYTLLDSAARHLNGHRPSVVGNALALPFRERSFDLVSCSLFLHHLEPDEIRVFTAEALRVSRIAVLINDLRRSPLHLALIYAGFPLFRSRLTRHDAPASVRRAYTPKELRAMLAATDAAHVEISSYYLFRMSAIAWKSHRSAQNG
jgi:ubiquinone/menaquinone biosynthesis C-methylase UbiE